MTPPDRALPTLIPLPCERCRNTILQIVEAKRKTSMPFLSWWEMDCSCGIRFVNPDHTQRSREDLIKAWNTRFAPPEKMSGAVTLEFSEIEKTGDIVLVRQWSCEV